MSLDIVIGVCSAVFIVAAGSLCVWFSVLHRKRAVKIKGCAVAPSVVQKWRSRQSEIKALFFTGDNFDELKAFCPNIETTGGERPLVTFGRGDDREILPRGHWLYTYGGGVWWESTDNDFRSNYEPVAAGKENG
jgi:hypothetical protein